MRNLSILVLIVAGLFFLTGCECCGLCCADNCEKESSCEKCPSTGKCCGTCTGGGATATEADGCPGCDSLEAGGTGWCADCGAGYYEGSIVKCKGSCNARPGGPPCSACAK